MIARLPPASTLSSIGPRLSLLFYFDETGRRIRKLDAAKVRSQSGFEHQRQIAIRRRQWGQRTEGAELASHRNLFSSWLIDAARCATPTLPFLASSAAVARWRRLHGALRGDALQKGLSPRQTGSDRRTAQLRRGELRPS